MREKKLNLWPMLLASIWMLIGAGSAVAQDGFDNETGPTGSVHMIFLDSDGVPEGGLIVESDSTGEMGVTSDFGEVTFHDLPAGRQTFSVTKLFPPRNPEAGGFEEARIDVAVEVEVEPDGTITITITIKIKRDPEPPPEEPPPSCDSRPWCGVVGTRNGPNGNPRVVKGGGVHGNCPCTSDCGACPTGMKVIDPAPLGAHSIKIETCLGNPAKTCALPKKTAECKITI